MATDSGPPQVFKTKAIQDSTVEQSLSRDTTPATREQMEMDLFEGGENLHQGTRVYFRKKIMDSMEEVSGDLKILLDIENGLFNSRELQLLTLKCVISEINVIMLWCAFLDRLDLMKVLDKLGADVNFALPKIGISSIHLSALNGCLESTKWLIKKNCNVNLKFQSVTPLDCAVIGNSIDTTALLLKHGAKVEESQLYFAVKMDAVECLSLLVRRKMNVNSLDTTDMSPLHMAAHLGREQCLKVLLKCNIDVDMETKERNSALHLASEGGHVACVLLLANKGADVAKRNIRGQTPLHIAAKYHRSECVQTLLKAGADVNAKDSDNRTPLHAAVVWKDDLLACKTLEILLASGADLNARDDFGFSALHVAAINQLAQCVDVLIMEGADLGSQAKNGLTALAIIIERTPACLAIINKKLDSYITTHDSASSNWMGEVILEFEYFTQHSSIGECELLKRPDQQLLQRL
ncbi:transient receptor potential channel pyrexia-like [Macrosteles quadrilineatus]|uniref:transient receptor potential channel pyrexia-like n=1 Tax=Macrosteles quadrilineatus TaxID=74068 RepID=UPI0023E2789D|nr:transient receptor potential channel pyrexia-like [Macrosteles quadrilineatus]